MGLAEEVQEQLRAAGTPEIAEHSQRFFKTGPGEYGEGDRFLGVRVPVVRALLRKFRQLPMPELRKLIRSRFHEERLFAVLWLSEDGKKADDKQLKRNFDFYLRERRFINTWDLVDGSAPGVVGRWLADKDRSVLYELASAESLWDRRIAMLATYHFIKENDVDDVFDLATILRDDPEDLMHKAVGWMLREAGKKQRPRLDAFLAEHAAEMPRTMLRYAIEKHSPAERQRLMRLGR